MTYAADDLYREVAYVGYHMHWSLDEILGLTHRDRKRFITEIGDINTRTSRGG